MQRAKKALWPGAYDEDVIGLCAGIGAKAGGDARLTIHLLWAAAKKAESDGKKKIGVEHVQAIKERSYAHVKMPLTRKIDSLDELDKTIISIIADAKNGIESGGIYEQLNSSSAEQRTIRNRLERLEKTGLLTWEQSNVEGRTKIWKIKIVE
jgi:Cdc6-like AAA superfamily ATPase